MKRMLCLLMVISVVLPAAHGQRYETIDPNVRFTWVDVIVTSADAPLAAYQLELVAKTAGVAIVGIEGGDHPAFKKPAYYDPAALAKNRIILAAFTTANDLPSGKTRVARVHVRIAGDVAPEVAAKLIVAATTDGKEIKASASVVQADSQGDSQ